MEMTYKRGGVSISVYQLDGFGKNPALWIGTDKPNQTVKVASFGSQDKANIFCKWLEYLLKEQEAIKPDIDSEGTCSCGNCGTTIGYYQAGCSFPEKLCKYCPECGQEIKWNE